MLTFLIIYLLGVVAAFITIYAMRKEYSNSIWLSWLVPAGLIFFATALVLGIYYSDLIDFLERKKNEL